MRIRFLIALACTCIVQAGFAQKENFDYHVASLVLLQVKAVQKEVGITDAQRAKMNKHAEAHKAKLTAYSDELKKSAGSSKEEPAPEESRIQAMFAELKKNVFAELKPAQITRLREISLQQLGFSALNDEVVAKRVGLSDDQLKRVRKTFELGFNEAATIEKAAVDKAIKPYQSKKPATDAEAQKLLDEMQTKAEAARKTVSNRVDKIREFTKTKIMGILTDAQRKTFMSLMGKPYKDS